ncbi:MAG: hypothetical protein ABIW82_16765 [Dokdonella sp.]
MATISQVDRDRALRISPTRTGADLVARPDVERSITVVPSETPSVLDWLSAGTHIALFERNLQALSDTADGEPLLTTWFSLDEFEVVINGAAVPASLRSIKALLPQWREAGITDIYVDGYRVTTSVFYLNEPSGHTVVFGPTRAGKSFAPSTLIEGHKHAPSG